MVRRETKPPSESNENQQLPASRNGQSGLRIEPTFSTPGENPLDQVTWEKRSARIADEKGKTIFEQTDVEVPADWSQLATNVVVSKYFYGENGKNEREKSVRQLVHRVTRTITDWAAADGVFASEEDAERFYNELTYLCVNQYASFNSPVWFNVGLYHVNGVPGSEGNFHWDAKQNQAVRTLRNYEYPQASACFIQSVEDSMEDIMRLATAEAMLFKYGSGTGTDLSTLRSSREKLAGGGTPSGPLSFMRVYDQIAGVIKSGGKTRRAAKMQSLRCDHPDIREFITAKMDEEKKAWALIDAGYDGSFGGEAYSSVMFQNANLSIRVTDEFMQAAQDDADWQTYAVTSGQPMGKHKARELLDLIAQGTHICGDPGVQYHTTVNRWNTCPESGEICASNPCSEYMFLNDSACNLASLNLMKFRLPDGSFDVARFRAAVRVLVIAQETLVDHASYPSERICRNSHEFRPLGLGYANLGAMIMSLGLPYDGDAGRAVAGAVTAVMTGAAYATSAELASRMGTFPQYYRNRQSMLRVIGMHRQAVDHIDRAHCSCELLEAAAAAWDEALEAGEQFGYRNAQVSVLAPTGTIGFMMDCDTTGIEPDIALVKYKLLAGGGMFKIVNRTVPLALERLGYTAQQVSEIIEFIDEHDTIESAPHVSEEHLPVFDCAFKPANGQRSIHYMGHIRMMSAVQPFLSGAISKTVNMPKEATPEDIRQVYVDGWKLGLKAVAIYRDGSKRTQPLNVDKNADKKPVVKEVEAISAEQLELAKNAPHRHRLPATRPSITHKFDVAGHEGYLNVGLYEDGTPGELFITMAKEGSTVGGMMDAFATAISLCLQYGVPLEALVKKFSHQRFEPAGMTKNRDIPFAKSIVDYVFRWLGLTFLEEYRTQNLPSRSESGGAGLPGIPGSKPATKAAPEAVKDDEASSEPGRATQASDKDVRRPVGASSSGSYVSDRPGGGNGDTKGAVRAQAQAATETLSPRLARIERIDQQFSHYQEDAPACDVCGSITVRNGNCYKCYNCGSSLGCS
ncbi:MAG TPA: vitamin B12-dependent ribonucleotide reductase [Phycisphaerales bacterium]|nr:vitamin B12-dependent ribonucleotide reductase [Phycisphaerales bacterium]